MPSVAYGCCVGSWEKFGANVLPHAVAGAPVLGLSGQTSIAQAYNTILNALAAQGGFDLVILQHDDLEILDPDHVDKFADVFAADDQIALAGVAGGTPDPPAIAWWSGPSIGYQNTDSRPVDFGERSGDVLIIEGSIMVFSRWAIENLRFDQRYPGFLGYDDICVTAKLVHGKRVVVADVATHHHSTLGFKSEAIASSWAQADAIFRQKWSIG